MDNSPPDDDRRDVPTGASKRADTFESQTQYDSDDEDLTTTIVRAVAEAKGVEMTALKEPLLYDCIDAAALEDSLFTASGSPDASNRGKVQFRFHGRDVVIESDGWIRVYGTED